MHQQGCLDKLSTSIDWLMNSFGIALAVKVMLSVLQEAIFTYIAIDTTIINSSTTVIIILIAYSKGYKFKCLFSASFLEEKT